MQRPQDRKEWCDEMRGAEGTALRNRKATDVAGESRKESTRNLGRNNNLITPARVHIAALCSLVTNM